MLKLAFWNRHCQVLHHDGYRVGSFIMYPFLTEKKGICPQGKKEVSYRLSFSLYHPLPHMASEPTYTKLPLPSTYVAEHSPTPNYCLPVVICPPLRIRFQLYMAWIQREKRPPGPMPLFAIDLDSLGTEAFTSLIDRDSQRKARRFPWN